MNGLLRHPVRVMIRACGFLAIITTAFFEFVICQWIPNRGRVNARSRALWVHRYSTRVLNFLNVEVQHHGNPPKEGMLVCNHLSYVDILALGYVQPFIFVSKSTVKFWPIIGVLTMFGGTIFVNRDRRLDVVNAASRFEPVIEEGNVVVIFPEGTSSDGHQVLPFRSSLLAPAARKQWPVTAARIGYAVEDGAVETEVCYWGELMFVTHFLNLVSKRKIQCEIRFSEKPVTHSDRKELAAILHSKVKELMPTESEGV